MVTKMRTLVKKTKAVSPVIATLLLVAIAVAASVITYSWVTSMVNTQSRTSQTSITIEEVLFQMTSAPASAIKISLRNIGTVTATIQTIYVYKGDASIVRSDGIGYAISAGQLKSIGLNEGATWITSVGTPDDPLNNLPTFSAGFLASTAYTIKVVADNGFVVVGTFYTPVTGINGF